MSRQGSMRPWCYSAGQVAGYCAAGHSDLCVCVCVCVCVCACVRVVLFSLAVRPECSSKTRRNTC